MIYMCIRIYYLYRITSFLSFVSVIFFVGCWGKLDRFGSFAR